MSTYQMCILLLFNHEEELSLSDIRQMTGIPESDLRRHLLSLCTPKYRILNKSTASKVIVFGGNVASVLLYSGRYSVDDGISGLCVSQVCTCLERGVNLLYI